MKKFFMLTLVLAFVGMMAAPVFAADLESSFNKLGHGVVDIVKSPLVIYDHTKTEMEASDFMPLGMIKGLIESPFHVVYQAGHGVLDVITFPVD